MADARADKKTSGPGKGRFGVKSLSALAIKFGAAGLSFVMFVTLARAMTQDDYGRFGFAFSLATILAVIGTVGQRNLVLRYASVYLDGGQTRQAVGVIRDSYRLVLLGCLAMALGLVAFAFVAPLIVPGLAEQRALFLATAVLTVVLGLAEFQPNPQRAAGSVARALLPRDILLRALMIGVGILAIQGFVPQFDAIAAVLIMCALMAVLTFAQAFSLSWTHPKTLIWEEADTTDRPQWRKTLWGMWGNSVVNSAGRNVAVVIVGGVLPAATLGAFFAALRTSMVLELFLIAINVVAAPLLAARLANKKLDEVQKICTRISLMLGLPTLACFVIFVLWGDRVLNLFGEGFSQAHPELIIMSFGYLFSAFSGPTTQLMEMAGHERSFFVMLVVTTGLSLLAIPFAAQAFGSQGAAACIAFNLVALNLSAYVFIYRRIGVSSGIIRFGRPSKKADT